MAQAGVPAAAAAPRCEGGPEGGNPADDCLDRAAGVAAAEAAAEAGSDAAADAAADVGTEAASESPADWPPGTKKAGAGAAAAPLAANAPALITLLFCCCDPCVIRQPGMQRLHSDCPVSQRSANTDHITSQLCTHWSACHTPGGGAKAAERTPLLLLPLALRGSTYRERTPRSGGAADAGASPLEGEASS